jgi:hypothetical protein
MKLILLFLFVVINFTTIYAQTKLDSLQESIETVEVQKGKLLYKNYTLGKFEHIEKVLLKTNSYEIKQLLSTYKTNVGATNVLGFIGGFGIGWFISQRLQYRNQVSFQDAPKGFLLIGSGFTILSLITNATANNNLRKAAAIHNKNVLNRLSFSPSFQKDSKSISFSYHF